MFPSIANDRLSWLLAIDMPVSAHGKHWQECEALSWIVPSAGLQYVILGQDISPSVMAAEIVGRNESTFTVQVEIPYCKSMLDFERAIQSGLN